MYGGRSADGPKFGPALRKRKDGRFVIPVQLDHSAVVTHLRDTLKDVKTQHKNVTLSLPEPLLRRFRIYAASRNESMTSVMADAIRRLMSDDAGSSRAKRRFLDRIR